MFLRAKKECNSGTPKGMGGCAWEGVWIENATGSAGAEQPTPVMRGNPKRE
jgi:hypothetical protein